MSPWIKHLIVLTASRRPKARRHRTYLPTLEELGTRCLLSAGGFLQTNIISDVPGLATVTDTNLSNPWGIVANPTGPFWFGDNNTSLSSMGGAATTTALPFAVNVDGLNGGPAAVTGVAFSDGGGFTIGDGSNSGPSMFLFATEQGTILGWNPAANLNDALVAVNNSSAIGLGPVYTGLAVANTAAGEFLYAANFRTGAIDVFDQNFQPVHQPGAFTDRAIEPGYVPFNIQFLDGRLYVTYSENNQGSYESGDEVGAGFVDVFDTQGYLLNHLVSEGQLSSPWGLALAPSNFGNFSGALLVGNFGDGRINAFDPDTGAFLGEMTDSNGDAIEIPKLWGLSFGNDAMAGPSNTLFFTAGIGDEAHGLFGSVQPDLPGVQGGVTAQQQEQLDEIDAAPPGVDSYPLPPGNGPALTTAPIAADRLSATLVPLNGGSLALAPTLLSNSSTIAQSNRLVNTNIPTGSSSENAAATPVANSAGNDLAPLWFRTSNQPASTDWPASAPVTPQGATTISNPVGSPTATTTTAETRGVSAETTVDAGWNGVVASLTASQNGSEVPVASTSARPQKGAEPAGAVPDQPAAKTASLMPHYLTLLFASWYGMYLAEFRPTRTAAGPFLSLKSLWSRLTRRFGSTLFGTGAINPSAADQATCIMAIDFEPEA